MNDNQLLASFERYNDSPEAVSRRRDIIRRGRINVANLYYREKALQPVEQPVAQPEPQPEQAAQLGAQVIAMPSPQSEIHNPALDIEAIRKDIQAA